VVVAGAVARSVSGRFAVGVFVGGCWCRAARASPGRGAGALRHVEGGDGMAFAVDDGESVLQGDLVLVQDAVDAVAQRFRRAQSGGPAVRIREMPRCWLRPQAATRQSIPLRRARWPRCTAPVLSASGLESLRISLGFCENQRSTARFIRP
jgi:hypothetical protein